MKDSSDKIYLERPEGQPAHVPQSYVRPAPGRFVEKPEIPAYVADAALRWKNAGSGGGEGGQL